MPRVKSAKKSAYKLNANQRRALCRIHEAGDRVEAGEVHARGVVHPNTVAVLVRERYARRLKSGAVSLLAKGKRKARKLVANG